jgi:hypothetical protein
VTSTAGCSRSSNGVVLTTWSLYFGGWGSADEHADATPARVSNKINRTVGVFALRVTEACLNPITLPRSA